MSKQSRNFPTCVSVLISRTYLLVLGAESANLLRVTLFLLRSLNLQCYGVAKKKTKRKRGLAQKPNKNGYHDFSVRFVVICLLIVSVGNVTPSFTRQTRLKGDFFL